MVFLGTGGATPTKYRGVTSSYVCIGGGRGMLFDCGDGTYVQLLRRFGEDGTAALLRGECRVK